MSESMTDTKEIIGRVNHRRGQGVSGAVRERRILIWFKQPFCSPQTLVRSSQWMAEG